MGNQLVGIAPSQIFPVEHYLTEHNELKFDISLGSTRFLKVARAESQEGLIVVKVFAIHDPSLPLIPYKERLDEIRNKLASAFHSLPFQKIVVTEKAGLIMREYVKYSLYDRVSTRPFLTNIEKRWITFQVLYALYECHKVGVCHGDIKLENIAVTSWNWVLLVDFASFKPTFLPEDNPADYSYFFDTSRRRACYIAPERFIKTLSCDSNTMFNENPCNSGELKPPMDIFSAGCALLELWNEGHSPFELSHLLAYRTGEYSPQRHLNRLEDPALRNLLGSMIQKDPSQRLSAELYMDQERGRLFPEYFYTFMQSYMLMFSSNTLRTCDEKIKILKDDVTDLQKCPQLEVGGHDDKFGRLNPNVGNMFKILCPEEDCCNEDGGEYKNGRSHRDNGLVIIVSLVTSCIRGLHDCTSKLKSLEILHELAMHANEETVLDRILPYIMYLVHDPNSRVKVAAINIITKCLSVVKHVPRSDANIFPEYILPCLAPLATDPSTCVRAAYAKNIANLADIAMVYLEYTQTDFNDKNASKHNNSRPNYEVELQTLHDMVQTTVSALLTDQQAIVKQTLMDSGITKLCVFFGKQKAYDVLLSHIITFLNDKEDKELRGTFFDCIVGVAAYIGWHCSSILSPLLIQGLTDSSEFVTMKAIHAMASLTELGLLPKPILTELVSECASYLTHPNLWIRQAVAGFVCISAKCLSLLDIQCKIMPLLEPFMKYPIIQIESAELLLDSLVSPIPRSVYDSIVKCPEVSLLLEILIKRKQAREAVLAGKIPNGDYIQDMPQSIRNLIRRLEANGMNESVENNLLRMHQFLIKLSKHRLSAEANGNQNDGKIDIKSHQSTVRGHLYNLGDTRNKPDFATQITADISRRQSESTNSGGAPSRSTSSRPASPSVDPNAHSARFSTEPPPNMSLHERSYIQYRIANCSMELRKLIERQQNHYLEALRSKEWAEQAAWQPQLPPPGWRLGGSLVAHLHEHRGPVTRLAPIPETCLFASASTDGYIKLWDCSKMEGKNIANRSKVNYKLAGGSGVIGLAVCENGQSLAAASQDGAINVLRLDCASSRMSPLQSRQLNPDEDGCAVDVQYLDSGPQSVLVYATLYGSLVGWDLRAPGCAWRLENGQQKGVITSFCLDSHQSWLTLGTSSGSHIAWDLRFQLPIATIEHPTNSVRIRKVVSHPTEHSWILSSVQGNNEISMWNLETGFRQKVLWASSNPPLSKTQITSHSVCAMQAGCIDRSGFLLAGGTDQRIRFWDLDSPSESYVPITAPNDSLQSCSISYKSRLIDGTCVIHEVVEHGNSSIPPGAASKADEVPKAGPEPPPSGHRDCISDIALCKTSQCFMLTASRDGVIKVWK